MNNRRETFERRHGGDGVRELWVTETRNAEHITLFTHMYILLLYYIIQQLL